MKDSEGTVSSKIAEQSAPKGSLSPPHYASPIMPNFLLSRSLPGRGLYTMLLYFVYARERFPAGFLSNGFVQLTKPRFYLVLEISGKKRFTQCIYPFYGSVFVDVVRSCKIW